jgi:Protein of unknown function (DUF2768).
MSSLDKMWVSFIGIGLMAVASLLITFARLKTKGVIRVVLSLVAFVLLLLGLLYGVISMF